MKQYWKNLEEKKGTAPDLTGQEFLNPPAETPPNPLDRRDFLKLVGASAALAGMVACTRRVSEKVVPYLDQPKDLVPGVANWYSSTCQECPSACGLLVKTREGRPIKLEGNPEHPVNEGGLCARGQASILNLYDPERLKKPLRGQKVMEWDSFDAAIVALMKQREIRTVRFLTKGGEGPATLSLM
ncbi:MAG: TAT-variant-translocated molybdopterin oxidoreductase, partial [bacterium]|nr:TAT-variant-translocated molybdopterin oxidoreductase [bacterium]